MHRYILAAVLGLACAVHAVDDRKFPEPAIAEKEPTAEQKKIIDALIVNLGDQQFDARKAAKEALISLGPVAVGQLRTAAKESQDAEIRRIAASIVASSQEEIWEGFYYYSTDPYEVAIKNRVRSVHFTLKVKRQENGEFTADGDEDGDLGKSKFAGNIDRKTGRVTFEKSYVNNANAWPYTGKWNAENGRVEGTYGRRDGGFILFPRKLTEEELKRLK